MWCVQVEVQAGHVAGRHADAGGRRRRRHRELALAARLRALGQGLPQRRRISQGAAAAGRRAPQDPARPTRTGLRTHSHGAALE